MVDRPAGDACPAPSGPEAGPTFLASPHLLVAQSVAAALRSAGVAVEALPFEALPWSVGIGDADADEVAERTVTDRLAVVLDLPIAPSVVTDLIEGARTPGLRVLVVTPDSRASWCGALLESDTVEVVEVSSSVEELAGVVERFSRGEPLMDPAERARLRAAWADELARRDDLAQRLQKLSTQEMRVLRMLAAGSRVSEVAQAVGVAEGTVRSHIKSLRAKLGAKNQLAAVAMLWQASGDESAAVVPQPRRRSAEDPERSASR